MTRHAIFPDLDGQSVFITGGGSGIGAFLTDGFMSQGANVSFDRRAQLIDATHSANFSAGVWYCKVLRGLSFN